MSPRGMAMRLLHRLVLLLVASMVSVSLLQAQAPPDTVKRQPPDSLRRDTVRVRIPDALRDSLRADSIRRAATTGARRDGTVLVVDSAAAAIERARQDSIRAARAVDTIKAPMAQFESPPDYETESRLRFDKQEILSSGAMYLADLLDRVPGVTSFRSGWLAGVHATAYRGDFRRVRIFIDGIEFDAIGPRQDGVVDQVEIPLWTLEAIEVERTPTEIRVWCRTATVQRTTPYTRVDIFTGDLNTNAFRGIFMRRFGNGMALQVAGQQLSTQRGRIQLGSGGSESEASGDGDQQVYNARLGWAGRRLSIDGYATAVTHRRDRMVAEEGHADLPRYQGTRRDGYLRVAYRDTAGGPWAMAMLATARTRLDGERAVTGEEGADTVRSDTVRTRAQTLIGAGWRRDRISVSLVDRVRGIAGKYQHSPAFRASYSSGFLDAGAYAERSIIDSTNRADAFVRVKPTAWSAVTVAQAAHQPDDSTFDRYENGTRVEAALRIFGRWIGAGIIRQGLSQAASPTLIGAAPLDLGIPASLGTLLSFRGSVYRDLRLDVQAVRWNEAAFARPQTQVFTQLRLASKWLSRFPRGEFSIDARLQHEWRDPVSFYYGAEGDQSIIRTTERTQLLHGILEIRIQQATLFYQYRNLTGGAYSQIPGIVMPPAVQMYGVRWEFWN